MSQQSLINVLSQDELNNIIAMYQNNISLREIERITHHGRPALAKMLTELGIKTSQGNHYRKYFFNFDFFEKINNELSAYWLGFMYADGCILPQNKYGEQEFKIQINEKDLELLEHFKEDIQSTYPIRYDKTKESVMVIQSLRSQKTVDDLKRLGCVEKKSLLLTFPTENQVPKEFVYHFIRGYFDGDGSITSFQLRPTHALSYSVNFVGTESFIKSLSPYLLEMGSIFPDKRKINSWYLGIQGNQQVKKVYELLYNNSTRYMQRKYDKFQPLMKQDENPGI